MKLPALLDTPADVHIRPLALQEPPPDMQALLTEYAQCAFSLPPGPSLLELVDMPGLRHARAAVLGARQTDRPLLVWLVCAPDGEAPDGSDLLAALLCLQELGIAGFGLCASTGEDEVLLPVVERLAPYAHVPLAARLPAHRRPPAALAARARRLRQTGVHTLSLAGADEAQRLAVSAALQDEPPAPAPRRTEHAPLLVTTETEVYFLEEDFTLSEPVPCSLDMSDAILRAEEQGCDALLIHVETPDDAYNLGQNAHMLRCAVCLLCESEEALEAALLCFNGRALVDARSDVDEGALRALAEGYGALVR